eukprot:Skav207737  [mRNA]  locus=scaffold362:348045:362283:- [translate_table: standard]
MPLMSMPFIPVLGRRANLCSLASAIQQFIDTACRQGEDPMTHAVTFDSFQLAICANSNLSVVAVVATQKAASVSTAVLRYKAREVHALLTSGDLGEAFGQLVGAAAEARAEKVSDYTLSSCLAEDDSAVRLPKELAGAAQEAHCKLFGFVSAKRLVVTYRDHPGLRDLKHRQRCIDLCPRSPVTHQAKQWSSLPDDPEDMLLAAMRAYPGNNSFTLRVEYGTLCRQYFGRTMAVLCQGLFQLAMLCANISNIIQTAQAGKRSVPGKGPEWLKGSLCSLITDPSNIEQAAGHFQKLVLDYFVASFNHNKSCGLMFYPHVGTICAESSEDVTPFGTGKLVLSLGLGMVAVLSIPLGYWNLDDNIIVQNVALAAKAMVHREGTRSITEAPGVDLRLRGSGTGK